MNRSKDAATTCLVEVKVLNDAQRRLDQDHERDDDKTNDLVVSVQLILSLCDNNAKRHTDDEQDDTERLERRVNVADLVGGGQVQGQSEDREEADE